VFPKHLIRLRRRMLYPAELLGQVPWICVGRNNEYDSIWAAQNQPMDHARTMGRACCRRPLRRIELKRPRLVVFSNLYNGSDGNPSASMQQLHFVQRFGRLSGRIEETVAVCTLLFNEHGEKWSVCEKDVPSAIHSRQSGWFAV